MMPHKIDWLVQDHVIFVATWGDMTDRQEIRTISEGIQAKIQAAVLPNVYLWVDMRYTKRYLPNIKELSSLTGAIQQPKLKHMILITEERMLHFFGQFIMTLGQREYHSFRSPQAGLHLLSERDPSLLLPDVDGYEAWLGQWRQAG